MATEAARTGVIDFHDAANIFPMDAEHLDALAADIKKNGQQVPVEIFNNKIIDGRRRYMACRAAGIKPQTRDVSPADPIAYVLSLNLHRRHLSPTQLAMVGARAREQYDKAAKERQQVRKGNQAGTTVENLPQLDSGSARDAVGSAVGVSGKSIDHATKVLRNGSPELVAAVDGDKIAVSTAARAASMSQDEQNAIVKRSETPGRKRSRPAESEGPDEQPDGDEATRKGMGVIRANEAINCLIRIPKNDGLRKRGFQLVTDWIKKNK